MRVLFLIEAPDEYTYSDVFAYFPDEDYNKEVYGNRLQISYSHVGQHSSCTADYAKECEEAEEYKELLNELIFIGYSDLEVVSKASVFGVQFLPDFDLTEYLEIHYDVVSGIEFARDSEQSTRVVKIQELAGTGGMYELAKELTDKFMLKYHNEIWDQDLEYFETIQEFIEQELYTKENK